MTFSQVQELCRQACCVLPHGGLAKDMRALLQGIIRRQSDDAVRDLQTIDAALDGFTWTDWGPEAQRLVREAATYWKE
jgi:hypothetical protein